MKQRNDESLSRGKAHKEERDKERRKRIYEIKKREA